nr:hypothetical protein [Fredinandcohnia onubensis]
MVDTLLQLARNNIVAPILGLSGGALFLYLIASHWQVIWSFLM